MTSRIYKVMIRKLLFISLFLSFTFTVEASTFYIDPENGDISNDGSITAPWNTLEAVINAGFIESYKYTVPYDPLNSTLVGFNINAPVTGGDTLVLLSGLHGEIFLRNYHNQQEITIVGEAGNRPILKSIKIQSGSNWNFEGVEVSSEPYGEYINSRLVFFESHGFQGPVFRITMSNCKVYSAIDPWVTAQEWLDNVSSGIFADGDSIMIENNQVENIDMGITAKGDYVTVLSNEIKNFSGDGLRLLGSYCLFENNVVKNCYDVDDNHDDGLQSFVLDQPPFRNNIIRGNKIINFEDPDQPLRGPLQGIACFDGFFINWTIENNLVVVDHWHGISLYGATDCIIVNNTVLDPTPDVTPGPTWIRIEDHKNGEASSGNKVYNNISSSLHLTGAIEGNNSALLSYTDYQNHFIDYSNYDFRLKGSSTFIDAADDLFAPAIDIDQIVRPQGDHADIGCYEFVNVTSTSHKHLEKWVNIYPNPFYDQIRIESLFSDVQLTIYTMDGNMILKRILREKNKEIDLSAFMEGAYFVKIEDLRNGNISSTMMIKSY